MRNKIVFGILMLLLCLFLSACKTAYPCDSRERRDECENYLGDDYDMAWFDTIVDSCDTYMRSVSYEFQVEIRQRCIASFFTDVEFSVINLCYDGERGLPAIRLAVACIETYRERNGD